jgi:hypothetical protein
MKADEQDNSGAKNVTSEMTSMVDFIAHVPAHQQFNTLDLYFVQLGSESSEKNFVKHL